MSVNKRIKELRTALGISQAKFAVKISISNGYIAELELGNRNVNERIVKLICAAYGVNEHWLKTGEGEMFAATQDEMLEKIAKIFQQLNPAFQDYVLHQIQQLLKLQKASKPPLDAPEETAEQE